MTILLVNDGWRGPIVFSDTGGEYPETYCYIEYFERSFLAKYNLQVTRLECGSEYHKRSHLSLYDFCIERGIIPILASRWCSVEWKRNPLNNWKKTHDYDISLVGISASEPSRARNDPSVKYPLVDRNITRGECYRIIKAAGLESPIKSGCFFCPGKSLAEWRRLYYDHPDLYERATKLEENAMHHNQRWFTLDPHGTSLTEHRQKRWAGQMQMDLTQWLPCACRL